MDARPQRSSRVLRGINDENSLPNGPLPKTIHHRNKSSPSLLGNVNSQNMKGIAKRTAFGDVSNIIGNKRASKDDSTVPSKGFSSTTLKPAQHLQERKSATFLRPAQRPLSVSGLKSLLTGSTTDSVVKTTASDSASSQPALSRKVLTKRNTIIFKDICLETVQEIEPIQKKLPPSLPDHTQTSQNYLPIDVGNTPLETRIDLPPPVEPIVVVEPVKLSQIPTSDFSLPGIDEVTLEEPSLSSEVDLPSAAAATIREDEPRSHPIEVAIVEPEYVDALPVQPEQTVSDTVKKTESASILPEEPILTMPSLHSLPLPHLEQPEPEEYWEEEYDDAYEDEGYVTARSFRSRDNTTGGATTVLFPQTNLKARKEISAAKKIVDATRTAEEIEDESFDTSMVAEYGDEIFEYMRSQEIRMLPNPHYMDNQHEIQWSMRSVLMDWLVQVHHRFNLLPETLFLCVNYIDRFLSCKVVSLGKLQLVGATAIFIAAKYEEINCPSVQEIVYMVDGGYSVDEILKAERFMLTMLQFELGWPGPMSFLRRISKADDYDLETRTLAKYFLEVTLMDERFIGSPPSFTAAASHCLARMMLRKGTWSPHHVYYSGYTWTQLKAIVQLLLECCEDPRRHHQAVYNKYCDKRFKRASAFVESEIQRGYNLPEITTAVKSTVHPSLQPFYHTAAFYA